MNLSHLTKDTPFVNDEVSPSTSGATKDAWNPDIHCVVPKPAAAAASESLLEMQNLSSHPGLSKYTAEF